MEKTFDDLTARQSQLIRAMRFPLIVLVLYEHSVGAYAGIGTPYGFLSEMISHHLCPIAVCWFFFFSGFLFFWNMEEGRFSFKWTVDKWKRRIWTLLIPYICWNTLTVVAIILKNYGFSLFGIPLSQDEMLTVQQGPLFWYISGPADFPLWFMLDMIVMTLITPFCYPIYRKWPWISLALLVLIYFSPWKPQTISIRAIFFFSLGAWMSINRFHFLSIGKSIKVFAAIAAIILIIGATASVDKPWHEWLLRAFYPFGMITFMNVCNWLIDNDGRRERLTKLSASVFFIYAAHEIYILGWTKGLFVRIFGEGLLGTWIKFLFVPIIVLAVCLVLYRLLNRLMPRTLAFLCGGRNR